MPDSTSLTFGTNQYITTTAGTGTTGLWAYTTDAYITNVGVSGGTPTLVNYDLKVKTGISPQLYFRYIKKKFGVLEQMKLDGRLKRLEKAFMKAVENGQSALGEKILTDLSREARESAISAKGIKHFIEYDDIQRYKRNIRDGHISDTKLEDFTRVIPQKVLDKKKKVQDCFDGFVIYHYWNEEAEKNRSTKQKMSQSEKDKLRDPVLFGVIKESNRLYFIADWEDEYCDLTFEEMLDVIGADEDETTIPRNPVL